MKYDSIEQIKKIKMLYNTGVYTRELAETLAKPYINDINRRGKKIAKNHNKKYYDISFASLMR
jgi:hypothetical protein